MSVPPAIACFDFDGTLTRRDTMLAFSQFVHGRWGWLWRMIYISPFLAAYFFKLISNNKAKEYYLKIMFGDMDESSLSTAGEAFTRQKLPALLRPDTIERLHWHQQQGHWVLLVTASLNYWTKAFAESQQMILVSSEGEAINGKFTGKLKGKNCHKQQKVIRIEQTWQQYFPGHALPSIRYAYGDSSGDTEMLAWATHPHKV